MRQDIYMNHAAATPVSEEVLRVMMPYFSQDFYNPSGLYTAARTIKQDIESARKDIALFLGSRSSEIIFTAGGTEANNLAINGIMQNFLEKNIVTSAAEHDSVLEPSNRYTHNKVSVKHDGRIDVDDLKNKIDDNTVLVSIMYANNEIGTIQPIRKVSSEIEEVRKHRIKTGNLLPIYFHTDACQATQYLDMHVSRLGVDMLTVNGGKIYGPKQIGALYVRSGVEISPQILGGGQERNMRSGTENVPGIVGLAAAIREVQKIREDEFKKLTRLQKIFYELLSTKLSRAVIIGSQKYRLPNNVHFMLPGQDNEKVIMALDEAGVQASVGSACSASREEASHVLLSIGLSEKEARSSLRFTLGRSTTEQQIRRTVDYLVNITR